MTAPDPPETPSGRVETASPPFAVSPDQAKPGVETGVSPRLRDKLNLITAGIFEEHQFDLVTARRQIGDGSEKVQRAVGGVIIDHGLPSIGKIVIPIDVDAETRPVI